MSNSKENTGILKNFDRSDLISIFALILSFAALGATIYEANILKQQQLLMQSEQKASFWPYLELRANYAIDESSLNYTLTVTNKGVGPAIIENHILEVGDVETNEFVQMSEALKTFFNSEDDISIQLGPPRGILSPEESMNWLTFSKPSNLSELKKLRSLKIVGGICYKNVFGESWTITSEMDEPALGCSIKINESSN